MRKHLASITSAAFFTFVRKVGLVLLRSGEPRQQWGIQLFHLGTPSHNVSIKFCLQQRHKHTQKFSVVGWHHNHVGIQTKTFYHSDTSIHFAFSRHNLLKENSRHFPGSGLNTSLNVLFNSYAIVDFLLEGVLLLCRSNIPKRYICVPLWHWRWPPEHIPGWSWQL